VKILLTESPNENGYIESLMNAYKNLGHEVYCDVNNFYSSNFIPDVVHIHWPERLYSWHTIVSLDDVDYYSLIKERLDWFRNNSVSIVYTIHNLKPHENNTMIDTDIFKLITKKSDILVHHCSHSVALFNEKYNKYLSNETESIVCHHGDYLLHYRKVDRRLARARYDIPQNKIVTLNFGRQRPYKNETFIANVFNKITNRSKYLVFAGVFDAPKVNRISHWYFKIRNKIRKHTSIGNKKFIYKSFPVAELPYILACADIVFIAQSEALNSGIIPLAATYELPIVMPDIGCFKESAEGCEYKTYAVNNQLDAIEKLTLAHDEVKESNVRNNENWLKNNSWKSHASNIVNAINKVRLAAEKKNRNCN